MLSVTNARSDDAATLEEVEAFLNDNADQGVRPRPTEQMKLAMDSGLALLIRDETALVGLSLVHQFRIEGGVRFFSEIGTMRITANGRGLQILLTRLHLAQMYVEEFGAAHHDIFAVVSHGSASEHNLTDVCGLTDWVPPKDLVTARACKGLPFSPAKRILHAEAPAIVRARAEMRAAHLDADIYALPRGKGEVRLDLGWLSPELLVV